MEVLKRIDKKLEDIIKRRNFTNFWEAFDYLKLAGYPEIDALIISSEIFDGNIWDDVISVENQQINSVTFSGGSASGITTNLHPIPISSDGTISGGNIVIKVYLMTDKANKNLKEIYKSYVRTKKYENIDEINDHIKTITTELTTELAIDLAKKWKNKFYD